MWVIRRRLIWTLLVTILMRLTVRFGRLMRFGRLVPMLKGGLRLVVGALGIRVTVDVWLFSTCSLRR